jgi:Leucine-rich repeat (LRR) protein
MSERAAAFHADDEIHRLLNSSHAENVRLALVLSQNPALRLRDHSQIVALALLHPDLELRALAIEALEAQGQPQLRAVIRTHWQTTHPAGKPAVLYAALKSIEQQLHLPKGGLQAYLASQLGVWPQGVSHRFPSAFLAWCATNLDEGTLALPESLSVLPKALLQLEGLQELILGGPELKRLPDWLGSLPGVQRMWLRQAALKRLPDSLRQWQALSAIRLDCPGLVAFPTMLADCAALREMEINAVSDKALIGLETLVQLEGLEIRAAHGLTRLPPDIGALKSLARLRIQQTGISTLPDSMVELSGLREWELIDSPLQGLPPWLSALRHLERLAIEFESADMLPSLIGMDALADLDVRCGALTDWPEDWCRLPALTRLTVRGHLTALPPAFAQLDSLMHLELNHHPFDTFPAPLLPLKNLQSLRLSHTGICVLPMVLQELDALTHLELAHNGMTEVPPVLYALTGLRYLDLRNNHLPQPAVQALRLALPETEIRMA